MRWLNKERCLMSKLTIWVPSLESTKVEGENWLQQIVLWPLFICRDSLSLVLILSFCLSVSHTHNLRKRVHTFYFLLPPLLFFPPPAFSFLVLLGSLASPSPGLCPRSQLCHTQLYCSSALFSASLEVVRLFIRWFSFASQDSRKILSINKRKFLQT